MQGRHCLETHLHNHKENASQWLQLANQVLHLCKKDHCYLRKIDNPKKGRIKQTEQLTPWETNNKKQELLKLAASSLL
jgi:hypothetical protein